MYLKFSEISETIMRLQNKTAIITGSNRGIGRAIALGFAREGAAVVVTYRHHQEEADDVVQVIKEGGGKAMAIMLDIQEPKSFKAVIQRSFDFLGGISILVNNAGIATRASFLDISQQELDDVFDVNCRNAFLFTQHIAKLMKEKGQGGSIINVSSISDEIAIPGLTHYQASKAAMTMFTKGIALELAQYNIRANILCPGLTATDINRTQWEGNPDVWQSRVEETPLKRAGTPNDHVGAAVYLASDESSWMTGTRIVVDGGRSLI